MLPSDATEPSLTEAIRCLDRLEELAEQVRSMRVVDRMAPLLAEAERHATHADVRGLAERIATLRAV